MPIELHTTTADERAKERADWLALAERVRLATDTLPTGRTMASGRLLNDAVRVMRTPDGYELAGDLMVFGVVAPDVLPLHAVDDADAVAQADRMVRARWVRECCDGPCRADGEAEAAALV